MTREDIIRMAREAEKLWVQHGDENDSNRFLEIFAALVAKAEREACAKLCDRLAETMDFGTGYYEECAAAIRARGGEMKSSKQKRTCAKCGHTYSASAFTTRTGFTCRWCARGESK